MLIWWLLPELVPGVEVVAVEGEAVSAAAVAFAAGVL
jgi:hypothetical protein